MVLSRLDCSYVITIAKIVQVYIIESYSNPKSPVFLDG